MSDDALPSVNRLKALGIVNASPTIHHLPPEKRTELEDAVEQDLDAASEQVAHDGERITKLEEDVHAMSEAVFQYHDSAAERVIVDEERLGHVERQTHGLAEAVIAMTETSDTLAPAVKAVKDEMTEANPAAPSYLKSF